ncbi:unnamed protein product, partial [Didymodactylos carnosus]
LAQFEQCLENVRKLEKDIQEKQEQIQKFSKNIANINKEMQENDENFDDLLLAKRSQFEYTLNSYQAQGFKERNRNQCEITAFWDRFDTVKEKKDVEILEEHLEERNALKKLEGSLKEKTKELEKLEDKKNHLNNLISEINTEISTLKTKANSIDEGIRKLKEEEKKLEKKKSEEIRTKKAEKIFLDVGGSTKVVPDNNQDSRPHNDCVVTPGVGYCHYLGAVEEAIDFVSKKLDSEVSIDVEETKNQLLAHLSSSTDYPHSVAKITDGKHTNDLKIVVDETVKKINELRHEAEEIEKKYDETIQKNTADIKQKEKEKTDIENDIVKKKDILLKYQQEIVNNCLTIFNIKENIKYIKSGIKQKKEIIPIIEKKKKVSDSRLQFANKYTTIKQKDVPSQIKEYKGLLKTINQSDSCSTFLRDQDQQITQLINCLSCLVDENKNKRPDSKSNNLPDNLNLKTNRKIYARQSHH